MIFLSACSTETHAASYDWKSDWAVADGFLLERDVGGLQFPTTIAFVPDPGTEPNDPLYFVTELKGKVLAVTNDRSIFTFAENFFELQPKAELPDFEGEVGLAGICLEPEYGYVFVTFAYHDVNGVLRNNIVRFQSTPYTFSTEPTAQIAFTEIFSGDESSPSHQIGPCQTVDDSLYVGVGDGEKASKSRQLGSTLGKILRMSFDGNPIETNPFYDGADSENPANYVWAYGLRNPFGLKAVGARIFVADNGRKIDRFLEIERGADYLWDGDEVSNGVNADAVFSPGFGVAQLNRYPEESLLFPEQFRQSFFLAVTGNTQVTELEESRKQPPRILTFEYGIEQSRLLSVPTPIIRYRGDGIQMIVGADFGPDGLYFVPLFPDPEGVSTVLKLRYSPGDEHPFVLEEEADPLQIMDELGCFGCHTLNNNQGGTIAPLLDRDQLVSRLTTKLNSAEYFQQLADADLLEEEPFVSFVGAREVVRKAEGEEKIRAWIQYTIQEPRFDGPGDRMPSLGIGGEEALLIAEYLLKEQQDAGVMQNIKQVLRILTPDAYGRKHILLAFFAGLVTAGPILLLTMRLIRIRNNRKIE